MHPIEQPHQRLTHHVWEDSKEWVSRNWLSWWGKEFYKRRKKTIEHCFADAKELHGLRYVRYRDQAKVLEQCLLTVVAQNIKKMANYGELIIREGRAVRWLPAFLIFLPVCLPRIFSCMKKPQNMLNIWGLSPIWSY